MHGEPAHSSAPEPAGSWLSRLSLRFKVTVLLLGISLAPLLTAGFVNINRATVRGKAAERTRFAQVAEHTAAAYDALLTRTLHTVQRLARRFPVEAVSFAKIARELDQGAGPRASLKGWRDAAFLTDTDDDLNMLFLTLADGRVFYTFPYRMFLKTPTVNGIGGFDRLAREGGLAAATLPTLTGSSRPVLIAFAPLIRLDGTTAGHLAAIVEAQRLHDVIDGMLRRHSSDGINRGVMLTDAASTIVTHDRPSANPRAELLPLRRLRGPVVGELMVEDQRVLAARTEVGSKQWFVTVVAPVNQVYRYVHALIWVLVIVTVLTFIFVFLLADYVATVLLSPIEELQRGAEMIGSGALEYRIDLERHRGDELGRVALSFNQMGENLLRTRKKVDSYSRSLETAQEELDAMVYGITHDLKKALRGIDAYASFVVEDFGEVLNDEGVGMLQSISNNVDRISRLADDLIGLVETDREPGKSTRFDLAAVLDEARKQVLARRQGEVVIHGVPPELSGNRGRLVIVFEHLFDNGLKFNRSQTARVEVRFFDEMLDWRIDVEDNGIGIELEYREHVFELFTRLNQQDEFPGNGTGLNLARRIVASHRGRIDVAESPTGQTRFSVYLPKSLISLTGAHPIVRATRS
jgi:signal transduction histidine kinase